MRISWILPEAEYAGGTKVIAIYCEQLMASGHEVVVISTPMQPWSLRRLLRSFFRNGRLPIQPKRRPTYFDETCIDHRVIDKARSINDNDIPDGDLVIATWWETARAVNALSRSKGTKVYFMQDYGAPGMELEDLIPTWRLPLYIITISQFLVDLMHKHVGKIPVDLVGNSVDSEQFHAPPRGKSAIPTVGYLYRAEWVKGSDIVLKAVRLARNEIPNLRLLAYGPRKKPGERPIPKGMDYRLFPANDELKFIYASCDAWLFASRTEGFGLPILEAMACRTPVIATPAGAAPELITAQNGGVLIDHESPEQMAREIVRFCKMEESEWQVISAAALKTSTTYTWDEAGRQFEESLKRAYEIDAPKRKADVDALQS
ncbi:MAG: glycosyltransferase family 4 protein [Myxococcota bacterium]